ncbi:hypothetical protein P7C71_g23, partial [Lecanoromycetidae sp. Uapishka_2]
MKFPIAATLLAATISASPIADNSSLIARDTPAGQIASKYDGSQPQDVFLPPINIWTFTSPNCQGAAVIHKKAIYGANIDQPKMRSIHIDRDLLNAESISFATTAGSPIPGVAKRGTPTVEEREYISSDCAKIIEYSAPTPLPSGLFLPEFGGCVEMLANLGIGCYTVKAPSADCWRFFYNSNF